MCNGSRSVVLIEAFGGLRNKFYCMFCKSLCAYVQNLVLLLPAIRALVCCLFHSLLFSVIKSYV